MKDTDYKAQIGLWLQLIFVFFLPLVQQVSVVALILLIVYSIFTGSVKESLFLVRRDKILWIFVLFYLVHVFGIFYSSNLHYGFFDLQVKLSYLLIPLTLSATLIRGLDLQRIKWFFIAGNSLAAIICLFLAILAYMKDGLIGHFFYIDYSRFLHTTYFSMYLNLSVIFLLNDWLDYSTQKKSRRTWIPFLILFLLLNIVLLFARTSLAVSIVSIFLFLLLKRKDWIKEKSKRFSVILGTLIFCLMLFTSFHFNNRFVQVEKVMEHSTETWNENRLTADTLKAAEDNSTSTRIRLWKNALQLIKVHPLTGVGTGDIKDELKAEYSRNSYQYGVAGDLNPHNQYLHTTVMLGLIGLCFLIAYLLVPSFFALRSRNWVYLSFILIVFLNAFTESILEVQKGVLFIAYFQTLLYLNVKSAKPGISEDSSGF